MPKEPSQPSSASTATPNVEEPETMGDCIVSQAENRWKQQVVPAAIKPSLPRGAATWIVLPLSNTDTFIVYSLGQRNDRVSFVTDPDTRLLITRQNRPVFRFALKNVPMQRGDVDNWGSDAVVMNAIHLCGTDSSLVYLILQAGNEGGFYIALQPHNGSYRLIPISDADQGKLVVSRSNPSSVEVWSAAEQGKCGACEKRFLVKKLDFDGTHFQLISKYKTKYEYAPFQEEPLVVNP